MAITPFFKKVSDDATYIHDRILGKAIEIAFPELVDETWDQVFEIIQPNIEQVSNEFSATGWQRLLKMSDAENEQFREVWVQELLEDRVKEVTKAMEAACLSEEEQKDIINKIKPQGEEAIRSNLDMLMVEGLKTFIGDLTSQELRKEGLYVLERKIS